MDLDATIKGATVSVQDVERMVEEIAAIPLADDVEFHIKSVSEIMDEADYPGVRVSMATLFDGVRTPLKLDISTGDAITPKEIRYCFPLMLEKRTIDVWAYNLETVLAEKLETVVSRTITNTRMRDFYDIDVLMKTYGDSLQPEVLHNALLATAKKRETEARLQNAQTVYAELETDAVMQNLWEAYQKRFPYAADLSWDDVMRSVWKLSNLAGI